MTPYFRRHTDRTRTRTCLHPGCSAQIPLTFPMCKPHWLQVPGEIRDRHVKARLAGDEHAAFNAEQDAIAFFLQRTIELDLDDELGAGQE